MNENCIFCKILKHEIPCTPVYEDEDILAFMDIGPIVKGHTLVIPKKHYATLAETPTDLLAKLIIAVQRVAGAQVNGLRAEGSNIIENNGKCSGQLVEHIHFHVIPRFTNDGHQWNWDAKSYENLDELEKIADSIRAHCA